MVELVRQLWCGLHGHDSLLQFEHDRIYLRCVSCGHETPGWDLHEAPPTVALESKHHARLVRPQLVGIRRVA